MPVEAASHPSPTNPDVRTRLIAALRDWWREDQADWDRQVSDDVTTDSDLWESMPVLDSKTVARMAPIFKKHLGRFDVRRIRPGGYAGIDDMIQDLVPQMTAQPSRDTFAREHGRVEP